MAPVEATTAPAPVEVGSVPVDGADAAPKVAAPDAEVVTTEDGADAAPKVEATTPAEAAPVKKTGFTRCFPSLCSKKKSQSKPIMVKQKTAVMKSSEDAEKSEDAEGSTLSDGTAEKATAEGADSSTEPAPQPEGTDPQIPPSKLQESATEKPESATEQPEAEGTDAPTEPAPVKKKSCFAKCFSMCTKQKSQKPVMVKQKSSEDPEKAAVDATVGAQPMSAEGATETAPMEKSATETAPMPGPPTEAQPAAVAVGADLPTAPAPAKKSLFSKCFGRSTKKGSQPLKPSSIVPIADESAIDIEQGTTPVHLGSGDKPFVIENVPTVSGTPIEVVATVDATGGTVDADVPGVAVAA